MSNGSTSPPSRVPAPQSLADLFDAGIRLVRPRYATWLLITALPGLPLALAALAANRLDGMLGALAWNFAMLAMLSGALQLGLVRAVAQARAGQPISVFGSYRLPARRYAALLLGLLPSECIRFVISLIIAFHPIYLRDLLGSPLLLLTIVLALVGLLVMAARLLFVAQIIVLEGGGPRAAWRRSTALVDRTLWRVWLTLVVLEGFGRLLVDVPFLLMLVFNNLVIWFVLSQGSLLYYVLLLVLLTPIRVAIYTALYYDLRTRNEGLDLAQRIEALAADATAANQDALPLARA